MSEFYLKTLNEILFYSNDVHLSDEVKLSHVREAIAETIGRKVCHRCGEIKQLDDFKIKENTFDGRAAICEVCRLKRCAKWRDKHRDKLNAKARERSKSDKVKAQRRERKKRWRVRHPDKLKAERGRYYQRRKDKNNADQLRIEQSQMADAHRTAT